METPQVEQQEIVASQVIAEEDTDILKSIDEKIESESKIEQEIIQEIKEEPVRVQIEPENEVVAVEVKPKSQVIAERYEGKASIVGEISTSVTDIRKAISVMDRFLYMKELFGNSQDAFNDALDSINAASSMQEAVDYLSQFNWEDNQTSQQFMKLITRRF